MRLKCVKNTADQGIVFHSVKPLRLTLDRVYTGQIIRMRNPFLEGLTSILNGNLVAFVCIGDDGAWGSFPLENFVNGDDEK